MLTDVDAIGTDRPLPRNERPFAGGRVIFCPGDAPLAFRAFNAQDVLIGKYRTDEEAQAAIIVALPPDAPRPPKVEHCRHCRGLHASDNCPVEKAAAALREKKRRERERAREDGEAQARSHTEFVGGPVSGLAARWSRREVGRLRRDDLPDPPGCAPKRCRDGLLDVNQPARGRGEDEERGRENDAGGVRPNGDRGSEGIPPHAPGERGPGAEHLVRDPDGGGTGWSGEASGGGRDGVPESESGMTDTHTLDDYHRALSEVATKGPVSIHVVACKIHGIGSARTMYYATELALEELVAQGRADRDIAGRYRARVLTADGWPGRGGIPPIRATDDARAEDAVRELDDIPGVPSDPPPSPGDILDPETLAPEDPSECGAKASCHDMPHCPCELYVPHAHDAAEPGEPEPEIVQPELPVPAEVLQTIDDVAARHSPRPELASVEAVLKEADVLRQRTEMALAVALSDVEDANAREAAAREAHEAAFRAAKEKTDRLRQVQQLAALLGVVQESRA